MVIKDNISQGNILTALEFGAFPKKLKCNKNITKIYRVQGYDSIMFGYFCLEFINFMFKGKGLIDYTNLFPPNEYETNNKLTYNI